MFYSDWNERQTIALPLKCEFFKLLYSLKTIKSNCSLSYHIVPGIFYLFILLYIYFFFLKHDFTSCSLCMPLNFSPSFCVGSLLTCPPYLLSLQDWLLVPVSLVQNSCTDSTTQAAETGLVQPGHTSPTHLNPVQQHSQIQICQSNFQVW